MLEIRGLSVCYGDAQALDDVDLDVGAGEVVALVGANGAGKTTLIRTVAGILAPRSGSIRFDGQAIGGLPSHRVCNLGVGQVAEGRQVFPSMSVLDNLQLGALLPRARAEARATLERVYAMFPRLAERAAQAAGTLSGGEQQMLAIGRCLMGAPRLVMFDEPSLGLAPKMVRLIFDLIVAIRDAGTSILLVEQNVRSALRVADYGYVMDAGHIRLHGDADRLRDDPRVRDSYLGGASA